MKTTGQSMQAGASASASSRKPEWAASRAAGRMAERAASRAAGRMADPAPFQAAAHPVASASPGTLQTSECAAASAASDFGSASERGGGGPAIVAVDGGGTSATFLACDADGAVLARATTGPTSQKAVGEQAAASELARGFSQLAAQGADATRAGVVVCGLSGFDSPASARIQNGMLDACGIPRDRRVLCSDALLPLFAAGLSTGAVVIVGTGSIAVSLDAEGGVHRAGGWGYEWSDAGSGHWMGARALEQTLAFRDGRGERDALFDEVTAIAGAETLDDLAWWAVDGPSASDVARFAPAVLRGGSAAARGIREKAAAEVALLYGGLVARMVARGLPAPRDLVLAGGAFSSSAFARLVEKGILSACGALSPRMRFASREPVLGGVEMGRLFLVGRLPNLRWA